MSDTLDLTMLSGLGLASERELRLLRLQVDNLASRSSGLDVRLSGIEGRCAAIEQSIHELVGEIARGSGQVQQQIARQEKRIEAVDAGLAALRNALAESTASILLAIRAQS